MRRCDVLIVGGGPAGSTAARALVRSGLDVLLIDKAEFPRDKVCAGWITPAVLEELELDADAYRRQGLVLQPIRGFRIGRIDGGGRAHRIDYGEVASYGIRRCEFDDFLLRRSGARLELATPLHSLERRGPAWVANGELEAAVVVGAGGHFCPVARHLLAASGGTGEPPAEPVVVAQELELEMSPAQVEDCQAAARADGEIPELYFADDLRGYGWCFRKGNVLNVGLGRQDRRGLAEHVRRFVARLREWGRIPPDLDGRFKGHAYLIYGESERPATGDGLLLIGDAAGLAYPGSGEGIRPAVESALLAAGALVSAPSFDQAGLEAALAGYRSALVERFGPVASRRAPVSRFVPESLRRAAARRLLSSAWFDRRILLDRFFLHRGQEPLPAWEGEARREAAAAS